MGPTADSRGREAHNSRLHSDRHHLRRRHHRCQYHSKQSSYRLEIERRASE